jgi:hypothetical protein
MAKKHYAQVQLEEHYRNAVISQVVKGSPSNLAVFKIRRSCGCEFYNEAGDTYPYRSFYDLSRLAGPCKQHDVYKIVLKNS